MSAITTITKLTVTFGAAALLLGGTGCRGKEERRLAREAAEPSAATETASFDEVGAKHAGAEGKMGRRDSSRRPSGQYAMKSVAEEPSAAPPPASPGPGGMAGLEEAEARVKDKRKADEEQDQGGEGETGARSRSWFPESFLFEPLVVTDDGGAAVVSVRVPDRLTTWRVLALAHSKTGAQAGAVTSFLGTLPVYVDPVVPPFLLSGDEIRLPVQVVNTTTEPVTGALRVEAAGAAVSARPTPLTVEAGGGAVEMLSLKVAKPGQVQLHAAFGTADAIVRTIDVLPTGRPVTETRSGTLAAPRTVDTTGPADADPASDRVRLLVFPGALALLRSELGACLGRGGIAEDAYTLFLAGKAPALLAALGDKPDPQALRKTSILVGQRAVRHGRALDVTSAALLAPAALAHADNPVLGRLGERAADYLASNQRPDGTFGGETGWTLQRLLVTTAEATRAVQAAAGESQASRVRASTVAIRASGAFERNVKLVEEGYTAAAILASGGAPGTLGDALREKVLAGIERRDDGARYLKVQPGVVRPDGTVPSEVEATALAVLALQAAPAGAGGAGSAGAGGNAAAADPALLADLGTTLLAAYSPWSGWGDGRANLVCLQAVLALFKDPMPARIVVTLKRDGVALAEGTIEGDRIRDVLALATEAPGLAGAHRWEIVAEPPVPGLGYSLTLESWVPWSTESMQGGLELSLVAPEKAQVGKGAPVEVKAVAPGGLALKIHQSLPAGVQVNEASLQALVDASKITSYELADGSVELVVPPLDPGQIFQATYQVVPTLAGTLRSSASSIALADDPSRVFHVPPTVWKIE